MKTLDDYYVDMSGGVPELRPKPGPKFKNGRRVEQTPQNSQPRTRRKTADERLSESRLSTEAAEGLLCIAESPELYLTAEVYAEWLQRGYIRKPVLDRKSVV